MKTFHDLVATIAGEVRAHDCDEATDGDEGILEIRVLDALRPYLTEEAYLHFLATRMPDPDQAELPFSHLSRPNRTSVENTAAA